MEEAILNIIKKEYEDAKSKKEKCKKALTRINELEQNEAVKEYLELIDFLENVDYERIIDWTEEKMYDIAFRRNIISIKETNGIYVCLGTFKVSNEIDIVHGANDYRLNRNDPKAEYRRYRDIEKYDSIQIPINKCDEFEKTHKVIFPRNFCEEEFYYKLQTEFIKISIEENQELACEKILKLGSFIS